MEPVDEEAFVLDDDDLISLAEVTAIVEASLWAFKYVKHQDQANACMHCAPVRYSPVTFRLAQAIAVFDPEMLNDPDMADVLEHVGAYALDLGR